MKVAVWITEAGWEAAVDAAALLPEAEVTLIHVAGGEAVAPGGALAGLLGRRRPDLEARVAELGDEVAGELLDAAAERLGRPPAARELRRGRPEHEVLDAAGGADVLVVSRATLDPGPRSLGHAARFVVDHAPCRVLLVWPGEPPDRPPPPPPPRPPH